MTFAGLFVVLKQFSEVIWNVFRVVEIQGIILIYFRESVFKSMIDFNYDFILGVN